MPDSIRAAITAVAASQHGVLSVSQTVRVGAGRNRLARWEARGEAVRVGHGIYRLAGFPDTWDARAVAASLAVERHGAVSHFAAARVLGLPLRTRRRERAEIEVTYFRRERIAEPPVRAHESNVLVRDDVLRVGHVQVTDPTFTIGALASRVFDHELVQLVDASVAEGHTTATKLAGLAARLWACPGVPRLRDALDAHAPQIALTRSERERRFFRLLGSAGLELPQVDRQVVDLSGVTRFFDFVWWRLGVWAEFDSHRFHSGSVARRGDGRRQNDLVILDGRRFLPLRFDDRDLFEQPEVIVATVRDTLEFARSEMQADVRP